MDVNWHGAQDEKYQGRAFADEVMYPAKYNEVIMNNFKIAARMNSCNR